MMNQFTWTQTTASQYAKWYAAKVANPMNNEDVSPEAFEKIESDMFVTEDGVRMSKCDLFFVVSKDFVCCVSYNPRQWELDNPKLFSTRQKALDYITFNKPVLAVKDIQEILVFRKNADLINELVALSHTRCHTLKSDNK